MQSWTAHSQAYVESLEEPGLQESALPQKESHLALGEYDGDGHGNGEAVQNYFRRLPNRSNTACFGDYRRTRLL